MSMEFLNPITQRPTGIPAPEGTPVLTGQYANVTAHNEPQREDQTGTDGEEPERAGE